MIERRGERAVWLRCIRTPDGVSSTRRQLPGRVAHDEKGFIHGYQRNLRIPEEVAPIQGVLLNEVVLQFGPARKINRAYVFRHPDQGGDIELEVTEITDRGFRFRASQPIEYWHEVRIDYEVSLLEAQGFEIEFGGGRAIKVPELFPHVIVSVNSIYRKAGDSFELISPKQYFHDFLNIHFRDSQPAGRLRVQVTLYETVPVAYREIKAGEQYQGQSAAVPMEQGTLEAVLSPWFNLSSDDLIIFTNSWNVVNETAERSRATSRGIYRLTRSPIREIEQVWYVDGGEPRELPRDCYRAAGFRELEIDGPIIPPTVSVVYSHYPQYRVMPHVSFSGLENRIQPKTYRLAIDSSTIMLAGVGET